MFVCPIRVDSGIVEKPHILGLFKNVQMQGARVSWSEAYFCVGRSNANGVQRRRWAFFNSPWLNYENY